MPNLGPTELILILLVVLLLFGAKRLPDTARSLGRSMRILKAETKGLRDDDERPGQTTVHAEQLPPPAQQQQPYGQPQYGQPQAPYGDPQQGTAPGETPGGAAQPPRP